MGHETTGQGAGGHGHGSSGGAHAHHAPPPPPEPRTPMWLPAVGAALFLVAALLWGLSSTEPAPTSGTAAPATSASAH